MSETKIQLSDKGRALARFGATNGRSIAKAAVFFTLGAALFIRENANAEKPLPRNSRRAAYEGADHGRATERHWLLGVTLAKRCADAVAETLASANDHSADSMVERLHNMLIGDAKAEGKDIADSKGRIIFAKLDSWISEAAGAAPAGVVERAERMAKAAEKLREECPSGDRAALASAFDKLRAELADMAKALRTLESDAEILASAKEHGIRREVETLAANLAKADPEEGGWIDDAGQRHESWAEMRRANAYS